MALNDVLDAALTLYRRTLPSVAVAVLVVLGPLNLLAAIPGDGATPFDPFAPLPSPGALALIGLAVLATIVVSPLVTAAVMWIAVQRDRGVELDWQDAYRVVGPRFGSLLGATALVGLIGLGLLVVAALPIAAVAVASPGLAVVLALLLILPLGLAFTAVFYLVVPVVLLEGATAGQAIRRSVELVRPRLWPTAGIVLLAGVLIGLAGGIVSFVFSAIGGLMPTGGFVLAAIGSTLNTAVTVPLTANVALLIYVDARIRRDGSDLAAITAGSTPSA